MTLQVRTTTDPAGLVTAVQNDLEALDRNLPVSDIRTMAKHMEFSLTGYNLAAELLSAAGLQALMLAAVGKR